MNPDQPEAPGNKLSRSMASDIEADRAKEALSQAKQHQRNILTEYRGETVLVNGPRLLPPHTRAGVERFTRFRDAVRARNRLIRTKEATDAQIWQLPHTSEYPKPYELRYCWRPPEVSEIPVMKHPEPDKVFVIRTQGYLAANMTMLEPLVFKSIFTASDYFNNNDTVHTWMRLSRVAPPGKAGFYRLERGNGGKRQPKPKFRPVRTRARGGRPGGRKAD